MNMSVHIRASMIILLGASALACSSAANLLPALDPSSTPTRTPRPTPTITPTPFYRVEAGMRIKLPSGGFSFSLPLGYDLVEQHVTSAYLQSSDERIQVSFYATPRIPGTALESVVKYMVEEIDTWYDHTAFDEPSPSDLNGVRALSVEFDGEDQDGALHGSLTIFAPEDSKLVYLIVIAHGDQRWEREGSKLLKVTRDHLEFFAIAPLEACPRTKNAEYGSTPGQPIRIGGGTLKGEERIMDYLEGLLGPRGEVIPYYEAESQVLNGRLLDSYEIRVGSQFRTLFFDTSGYEELRIPVGLACSSEPPQEP
jgi:hypothetical protein